MHPELDAWLNDVWGQHETMLRRSRKGTEYDMKKLADQVYSTYNKSLLTQEKATDNDKIQFLRDLAKLETRIRVPPKVQGKFDCEPGELMQCYLSFASAVWKRKT